MDDNNLRVFYQESQKLRMHKLGMNDAFLKISLTLVVVVWSFFGKAYIDSKKDPQNTSEQAHIVATNKTTEKIVSENPVSKKAIDINANKTIEKTISEEKNVNSSINENNKKELKSIYIFIAFIISTSVIGFWRYFANSINKSIAALYPGIVGCETMMGLPIELGIKNYLIKDSTNVEGRGKAIMDTSNDTELSIENKAKTIAQTVTDMVANKEIPRRAHNILDTFALVLIIGSWIPAYFFILTDKVHKIMTIVIGLIACVFIILEWLKMFWKYLRRLKK